MEFDVLNIVLLCIFIFLAGFVDAIAGGGGLISLPAYFAFGLPPHSALATNKFSSCVGTFTAVAQYYKANKINLKIGLLAALGALIGSALGAKAALLLPASVIHTAILFLVPAVLVFFLLKDRILPKEKNGEGKKGISFPLMRSFIIGGIIGFYDGIFGPGTGTFLAIAFCTFLSLNLVTASANARLANLASNFGSLVVFIINNKVIFPLAIYAALAGIAGNVIGARLAIKKEEKIIKPFMVIILFLLLGEVARRRFFS